MPIEFGHLPQRVQALQKRLDELFDQFWTFAQKFKNLPPDIGDRIIALETKLRENTSKIAEIVAKVAQLEAGLENANGKITVLETRVGALEPAVEGLRNALNELKTKVEANKAGIEGHTADIARINAKLNELEAKHGENQAKLIELVARLEDYARRIGVLEQWMTLIQDNKLPAIEANIVQLKTDRDKLNTVTDNLTESTRSNLQKINALSTKVDENKSNISSNTLAIGGLKTDVGENKEFCKRLEKSLRGFAEQYEQHAAKDLTWTPATNTLSWELNGKAKTAVIAGGGGGTAGVKSITYLRNVNQISWEDGNGSHFADIPFYHDTLYREPILGNNVRLGEAVLRTKSINELGLHQVRDEIDISSLIYNIVDKFFKPYENYIYADEEFLANRNKYNLLAHKCIQTVVGFGDGYADIKKHWEQNQIYPEIITGLKSNFPLQHNAIFSKYYGKEDYDVQNTNMVIQGTTFRYSTIRDAAIVNTGIDFHSIVQTLPDTPDSSINSKSNFKRYTTRLRNLVYTGKTDKDNFNLFAIAAQEFCIGDSDLLDDKDLLFHRLAFSPLHINETNVYIRRENIHLEGHVSFSEFTYDIPASFLYLLEYNGNSKKMILSLPIRSLLKMHYREESVNDVRLKYILQEASIGYNNLKQKIRFNCILEYNDLKSSPPKRINTNDFSNFEDLWKAIQIIKISPTLIELHFFDRA
nr:MAG TPA: chromosome segregation protein [Caudoviricetes sp.]